MRKENYSVHTQSPAETYTLGQQLGCLLRPGQVIALHGDLGAGKTVLTQGLAAGLGVTERVTSPTFTLVNRYHTADGFDLVHIDCYRLGDNSVDAALEASAFGLEEILEGEDVVVIEWAERVAALLPADHLEITIAQPEEDEQARQFTFAAGGLQSSKILQTLLVAQELDPE
jgi:tRNA threonylcarbamoyladenosine biosynthesis protein TsaE